MRISPSLARQRRSSSWTWLKTPIMLEFLFFTDDGDEALLSLDTLKELTIVPSDFSTPINRNMRNPKIRRVRDYEEEEKEEKVERVGHLTFRKE